MAEYKCPHCGEKIKKSNTKCPACGEEIYWLPVASDNVEIKTIKSRAYIKTGSTVSRVVLEKNISEKLFTQMFEVIAKVWKINHFIDNGLEGYEASFNIATGASETTASPRTKISTAQSATKVARESLRSAPVAAAAPPTEYDRLIASQLDDSKPKQKYQAPPPKPELLEFQQRLQQSTLNVNLPTISGNGDFTQNIF